MTLLSAHGTSLLEGDLIAKGTHGRVYVAYDDIHKQYYAFKKCTQLTPEALEVKIMTEISHPNLNAAISIAYTPNSLCIVQELAVSSLGIYLRTNPVHIHAMNWCKQLILALEHLHHHNIIHADIKPDNILIYRDLTIKLTDFSLSVLDLPPYSLHGQRAGTLAYAAPEILAYKAWDRSIDIWALGCTLWEILHGKSFFTSRRERISREHEEWLTKRKRKWKGISLKPPLFSLMSVLITEQTERISVDLIQGHPFFAS